MRRSATRPGRPAAVGFLQDRNGAVAVEFALVTALLLAPLLLLLGDSVLRISGERRLQDAMHTVSVTVASAPGTLDRPESLRALAADIAAVEPSELELNITTVCYCPDSGGVSAVPIGCQSPCNGRLTFNSLELVHLQEPLLPFNLSSGDSDTHVVRAKALVPAP